ncbi:hypothetical protein AAFX15_15525 [Vibrio chagasii]|uniref:hypothetical protein n=1 Tax=Vibrio chagasii TaxID=170679 RepID=UPI0038CE0431
MTKLKVLVSSTFKRRKSLTVPQVAVIIALTITFLINPERILNSKGVRKTVPENGVVHKISDTDLSRFSAFTGDSPIFA